MDEDLIVIKAIHEALYKYDLKYVSEISTDEETGCLTLLDGKLTICVRIMQDEGINPWISHVHVNSKIASFPDARLEACVVGFNENRKKALFQAGSIWVTMVGGPILSLCHAAEVGNAVYFCGQEKWGVQGCRGFVGPAIVRMADEKELYLETVSQSAMFDNVAELTPGGLVHIAKVTLNSNGKGGWKRYVEINGHEVRYINEVWEPGISLPSSGNAIISQFAVYHYADQPYIATERQALDDAILDYVKMIQEDDTLDPTAVSRVLVENGYQAELVYWLDHFVPLAFGRVLLMNKGVKFPDTYFLALSSGRLSEVRELMRNPVFARAQVIGWHLRESVDYHSAFKRVSLSSAEFNALNKALHAGSKPEDLSALPPIIPDLGIDHGDFEKATEIYLAQADQYNVNLIKKKPWWQFWN